ncbi:MAG: hypothetical protein FWE46_06645 [Coriobacteriia bacterium]|nr:hypothetical protein [Coriobacteriia bacterium]
MTARTDKTNKPSKLYSSQDRALIVATVAVAIVVLVLTVPFFASADTNGRRSIAQQIHETVSAWYQPDDVFQIEDLSLDANTLVTALANDVISSDSPASADVLAQASAHVSTATELIEALQEEHQIIELTADIDLNLSSDETTATLIIPAELNTLIISGPDGPYRISQLSETRHFYVEGQLTLQDLIIDGTANLDETVLRGGIILQGSAARLALNTGAVIENNRAINGGAILAGDQSVVLVRSGSTLQDNEAAENGGAIYVTHGATMMSTGSEPLTIRNNSAALSGGAIFTESANYNTPLNPCEQFVTPTQNTDEAAEAAEPAKAATPDAVACDKAAYHDLRLHNQLAFEGNAAGLGAFVPPINAQQDTEIDIPLSGPSVLAPQHTHPLNNYDINFQSPEGPVFDELIASEAGPEDAQALPGSADDVQLTDVEDSNHADEDVQQPTALPAYLPSLMMQATLQAPEGTTLPETAFDFQINPAQVQLGDDVHELSIEASQVPVIDADALRLSIDPDAATTHGGVTSAAAQLDLMDVLTQLSFEAGEGVYVWNINELATTTSTATTVQDSHGYQVRMAVDADDQIQTIEVFELLPTVDSASAADSFELGNKVDELNFTENYVATTSFLVALTVDAQEGPRSTNQVFELELELASHKLAPLPEGTTAVIRDDAGDPVAISGDLAASTITLHEGSNHFQMSHGQHLFIENIPVSTSFVLRQHAATQFTPHATVQVAGVEAGRYDLAIGEALETRAYNMSSAGDMVTLINEQEFVPGLGLALATGSAKLVLFGISIATAAYISARKRIEIEKTPPLQ